MIIASRRPRRLLGVALSLLLLATAPLAAAPEGSGLPVPRFVSLRASKANARTGPGEQYPIKWVYQRPGLPLEIVAEYYNWRRIRDWQGGEAWMHGSMLSGRRFVVVTGAGESLHDKPDAASPAVARLETGVIARVLSCPPAIVWCQVEVNGIRGWIGRDHLWGIYPGETVE